MNLSLAWWNTSLSPTYKQRDNAPSEQMAAAAAMVHKLIASYSTDLLALCEVSDGDISKLEDAGAFSDYDVVRATQKAGRSAFDMCVAYRADRLRCVDRREIISVSGGETVRIGQHLIFVVAAMTRPLHVFISHWPSRLNAQQHNPARQLWGVRLRDSVSRLLESDRNAQVVLVGDYNDEPFDTSIADNLLATRDLELTRRRTHLFYNPFWRHLSSFSGPGDGSYLSDLGSYYHKSGNQTRWRTFDQMMFSYGLVCGDEWNLNETATRVLNVPEYLKMVKDDSSRFDHLPIFGRLERKGI